MFLSHAENAALPLVIRKFSLNPDPSFLGGAAYIDGRYMPVAEAAIPITDWGYRRSDATYDVDGVWNGCFFRLDDHLQRFRASMDKLRLNPSESDADLRSMLHRLVALSGLREAYVAIDCLRGRPAAGRPITPPMPETISRPSPYPGYG
jgi:branched-chain amino acid aminotransferase